MHSGLKMIFEMDLTFFFRNQVLDRLQQKYQEVNMIQVGVILSLTETLVKRMILQPRPIK